MTDTNSVARSMHDVGLAGWFGGGLMGAIGLNGAAANVADPKLRTAVAADGWKRWAPVNAAAIGSHLIGGWLIVKANKGRLVSQSGVPAATGIKTVLTVAALASTAASGVLGAKVGKTTVHAIGATEPSAETPPDVAKAQRALRAMQWTTPLLTGALLVVSARMGEQQRPGQVASGLVSRLLPS